MAHISPGLEKLDLLKVPPTLGERALLEHLHNRLSNEYEIYFQPYFNGLRPDVVVMRKGWGVIIVEVKDWNLDSYVVDEANNWKLRLNKAKLLSPFQQVFKYKKSMFDLHIDGLAEAALINRNFYNIIKPFVYFHGSSKAGIDNIFAAAEQQVRVSRGEQNAKIENGTVEFKSYDKKMDYLEIKAKQINRDRAMAVSSDNLGKLEKTLRKHVLFTDDIYSKFKRYLQPPFHAEEEGKLITYGTLQTRLTQSIEGFAKIKGVAGSGKTTVLAKRAVNACKRHGDRVLILTFNLTLRNYIHDKISDIRENFSWANFDIINYHSFIAEQRNQAGCIVDGGATFEEIFSNERMFEGCEDRVTKYHTILVDEIQDFEKAWINIIRECFLENDGEMVLFGDEGQNIYNRPIAKTNAEIGRGFGRWERLTKSYRSKEDSPLTQLLAQFQESYLVDKYDVDTIDSGGGGLSLDIFQEPLQYQHVTGESNWSSLAAQIFDFIKANTAHPNDICIVGGEIAALRQIELAYKIRTGEETSTTFESQEAYEIQAAEVEEALANESTRLREKYPGRTDSDINIVELESRLEKIRRSKKYNFWLNSGKLKLSTVHSFKGLEAQNIIYILSGNDSDEIIYTGITRSRRNLLLFLPSGSRRSAFFEDRLTRRSDAMN